MEKFFLLVLFSGIMLLSVLSVCARQKTVSGTVSGADGRPLSDVTVSVRGTNVATKTNPSGYYSISAAPGHVLVFSFVDHINREITVGDNNSVSVSMQPASGQLEEVVVTAMDIKRNP